MFIVQYVITALIASVVEIFLNKEIYNYTECTDVDGIRVNTITIV